MKRRIISALFAIVLVLGLVCLASCGKKKDKHEHEFVDYVSNGDATCIKDGTKTAKCKGCDETDTVADTGSKGAHSFGEIVAETSATCEKEGIKAHYECAVCKKYFDSEKKEITDLVISKISHSYVLEVADAKYLKAAATCIEKAVYYKSCVCGDKGTDTFAYGDALGHKAGSAWLTEGEKHYHKCENGCDAKLDEAACSGGSQTCAGKAVCSVCKKEYGSIGSHNYTISKYDNTEHWNVCSCGAEGAHTAHSYKTELTAPTCTEQGYTTYTCECGKSYKDDYKNANGHTYSAEWSNDDSYHWHKSTCIHEEKSDYSAHTYTKVVTDPTCSAQGYTTYTCECGYSYVNDYVDAIPHTVVLELKSSVLVDARNCIYSFTYGGICSVCNAPVTEVKNKDNHSFFEKTVTAATCQSEGEKGKFCSSEECYYNTIAYETFKYTDPLSHTWVKDDDNTGNGITAYKCSDCAATKRTADGNTATIDGAKIDNITEVEFEGGTTIGIGDGIKDKINGKDVSISADTLDEEERNKTIEDANLSEEQKAQLGNNPIYNFTMSTDVEFRELGGTATIRIRYTLKDGEDPNHIIVWYISQGELLPCEAKYSEDENGIGYVTFETTHFSCYTVATVNPALLCEQFGHDQNNLFVALPSCTTNGYTICQRCGMFVEGSMVPATGHHMNREVVTPSSCSANGLMRIACTDCSLKYESVLPASGHFYSLTEFVAASCKNFGSQTYTCVHCYETYTVTVPQLNHNYNLVTVDATCMTDGYTEKNCVQCGDVIYAGYIPATGHVFDSEWHSAENGHCHLCVSCGETGPVFEHKPGAAATEQSAQICTECNAVIAPPIQHKHVLTLVKGTAASCTENGSISYYVCNCGNWFADEAANQLIIDHTTVIILALGHKQVVMDYVEPGCETIGYTAGVKCETCGIIIRGHVEINAYGHDMNEYIENNPSCTKDGVKCLKCANCGKTEVGGVIPALGHSYTITVKAPTCIEEGYTTYSCNRCDYTYKDDIKEALGHNFNSEWNSNADGHWHTCVRCAAIDNVSEHIGNYEEATTEHGITCIKCGFSVAEALEHVHIGVKTEAKAPGCEMSGNIAYYVCSCGEWFYDESCTLLITNRASVIVEATGHDLSYSEKQNSTCSNIGYEAGYYCNNCKIWVSGHEEIPVTGHSYVNGTCEICGVTADYTGTVLDGYYEGETYSGEDIVGLLFDGNMLYISMDRVVIPRWTAVYEIVGNEIKITISVDGSSGALSIEIGENYITIGLQGRYITLYRVELEEDPCLHKNEGTEKVDATCTEDGYIRTCCADCGIEIAYTKIPATGHQCAEGYYNDGENHWYLCNNCNESVEIEAHTYIANEKEPTCTENGYIEYKCSKCDFTTGEEIPATGHNDYDGDGKCDDCGYGEEVNELEALRADALNTLAVTWAHYSETATAYECREYESIRSMIENAENTDEIFEYLEKFKEFVNNLGNENPGCDHENTATEEVNATCTENGYIYTYCADCYEEISYTEIPAIGHYDNDGDCVCDACGETGIDADVEAWREAAFIVVDMIWGYIDDVATDEDKAFFDEVRDDIRSAISVEEITSAANRLDEYLLLDLELYRHYVLAVAADAWSYCYEYASESQYQEYEMYRDMISKAESVEEIKEISSKIGQLIFEITNEMNNPKCEHNYITNTIYSSCTEVGFEEQICDKCGDIIITEIPALGHDYGENGVCVRCGDGENSDICKHENTETKRVEATCTENGYIYIYCADCYEEIECTEISATGHNDYDGDGICDVCGDGENSDICKHENRATEEVEATCTENGYIYIYCADCYEEIDYTEIFSTGHNDYDGDGRCDACGDGDDEAEVDIEEVRKEALIYVENEWNSYESMIPADQKIFYSEIYKEIQIATSVEVINECIEKFDEFIKNLDSDIPEICVHDYFVSRMEPTCSSEGYITTTCKKCGIETTEVLGMIDHNYNENGYCTYCGQDAEGNVDIEEGRRQLLAAMESEWSKYHQDIVTDEHAAIYDQIIADVQKGTTVEELQNCSIRFVELINSINNGSSGCVHEYAEKIIDATCTDDGYIETFCVKCGEVTQRTLTVPAYGHIFNEGINICERCGYCEETDDLEMIRKELISKMNEIWNHYSWSASESQYSDYENYLFLVSNASSMEEIYEYYYRFEDFINRLGAENPQPGCEHEYEYADDYIAPTCESDGYGSRYCVKCGIVTEYVTIPALGHEYGEDGSCIRCGNGGEVVDIDYFRKEAIAYVINTWEQYADVIPEEQKSFQNEICKEISIANTVEEINAYLEKFNEFIRNLSEEGVVCEHEYTVYIHDATCSEEGYNEFVCIYCKYSYRDNYSGFAEHQFGESGYCDICGAWGEGICRHVNIAFDECEATCTANGWKYEYCVDCGETFNYVEYLAIGHILTADGMCERCGAWGEGICRHVNIAFDECEATCTANGWKYEYCVDCRETFNYVEYLAIGHILTADGICERCYECIHINFKTEVYEATCVEWGRKYECCEYCGYAVFIEEYAPLGHTFTDEGSCERCDVCNQNFICAHTDITTDIFEATCLQFGYVREYCVDCGYNISFVKYEILEHDFSESDEYCCICYINASELELLCRHPLDSRKTERVEATCFNYGYELEYCGECGEMCYYFEMPQSNIHYFVSVTVEPTCTSGGYTYHYCELCGMEYTNNYTDPVPHEYSNNNLDGTEYESDYYWCIWCGHYKDDEVQDYYHVA